MLKSHVKYAVQALSFVLFVAAGSDRCFAQSSNGDTSSQQASASNDQTAAIVNELAAMKKRIEELETELKNSKAPEHPSVPAATAKATVPSAPNGILPAPPPVAANQDTSSTLNTEVPQGPIAPFSDADWTWLNGNPRTKEIFWDSKFFTPEIRADVNYVSDFNHPTDHSIGGSSELFRSNEVQLEQLGIGGDFHYDNVRARFMTQFGMYSVTTPRNDPSVGHGQWDLSGSPPSGAVRRGWRRAAARSHVRRGHCRDPR